jgi:pyruvate/2-oxoglutarate dehydrogenase complex dihydrolipoamide dehydrogenase (E3) component
MRKQGLKVVPKATPQAVVKEADGTLTIELADGTKHGGFHQIVMAIGRTPVTEPLQLSKAGVTLQVRKQRRNGWESEAQ